MLVVVINGCAPFFFRRGKKAILALNVYFTRLSNLCFVIFTTGGGVLSIYNYHRLYLRCPSNCSGSCLVLVLVCPPSLAITMHGL